ncbi:MAG: DUF5320 domain-containing protein [Spirochaetia bacterium]|nr:DUF5320 domain-containing protein [Spirochaetia bacterium]
MPRGDRRGPNGMGQMTGRGAGFCNGFSTPGYNNLGVTGGFARGAGRGFARRFMGAGYMYGYAPFTAAVPFAGNTKEAEADYLENEITYLRDQLKVIEGRLAEMKAVEE